MKIKTVPKIHTSEWIGDHRRGQWVRKSPAINDKIAEVLLEARKFVNNQILKGNMITIRTIKDHFANPTARESFNEFVKNYIININVKKQSHEKKAFRTIQAYNSFATKLDEFNPRILFDEINPHLVYRFNEYLSSECQLKGVTRLKYFDKFKVTYKQAAHAELVVFSACPRTQKSEFFITSGRFSG